MSDLDAEAPRPVLVIHGVATRDREAFTAEVDTLGAELGDDVRLIPVYWGDFAPPADAVDTVLPYLDWTVESAFTAPRRRLLGEFYEMFRNQYLRVSAQFTGDLILYQQRHEELHAVIWETIMRDAPGWGLIDRPIDVVAHSMGSTMMFDLAVAGHPRLHIDRFVTCASQIGFFHAIDASPLSNGVVDLAEPVRLPESIGSWTNLFVPLDPWAFLSAPLFRLHSGGSPRDVEVYAGGLSDRIFTHAASHYWTHPVVLDAIRHDLGLAGGASMPSDS